VEFVFIAIFLVVAYVALLVWQRWKRR